MLTGCKKKVPPCDSPDIENDVIRIYREQIYVDTWVYDKVHKAYPYVNMSLLYPQATDYNADIDRYYCKGVIYIDNYKNDFKNLSYSIYEPRYINAFKNNITYEIYRSKNDIYITVYHSKDIDTEYGAKREELTQQLQLEKIKSEKIQREMEQAVQQEKKQLIEMNDRSRVEEEYNHVQNFF